MQPGSQYPSKTMQRLSISCLHPTPRLLQMEGVRKPSQLYLHLRRRKGELHPWPGTNTIDYQQYRPFTHMPTTRESHGCVCVCLHVCVCVSLCVCVFRIPFSGWFKGKPRRNPTLPLESAPFRGILFPVRTAIACPVSHFCASRAAALAAARYPWRSIDPWAPWGGPCPCRLTTWRRHRGPSRCGKRELSCAVSKPLV